MIVKKNVREWRKLCRIAKAAAVSSPSLATQNSRGFQGNQTAENMGVTQGVCSSLPHGDAETREEYITIYVFKGETLLHKLQHIDHLLASLSMCSLDPGESGFQKTPLVYVACQPEAVRLTPMCSVLQERRVN